MGALPPRSPSFPSDPLVPSEPLPPGDGLFGSMEPDVPLVPSVPSRPCEPSVPDPAREVGNVGDVIAEGDVRISAQARMAGHDDGDIAYSAIADPGISRKRHGDAPSQLAFHRGAAALHEGQTRLRPASQRLSFP